MGFVVTGELLRANPPANTDVNVVWQIASLLQSIAAVCLGAIIAGVYASWRRWFHIFLMLCFLVCATQMIAPPFSYVSYLWPQVLAGSASCVFAGIALMIALRRPAHRD